MPAKCVHEGALIHDRPARGVDQNRGGFHHRELGSSHHASAPLAQHHVDGQDVRPREELFPRDGRHLVLGGPVGSQVLAPGDDPHAERVRDGGDLLADISETEHAQGQALNTRP